MYKTLNYGRKQQNRMGSKLGVMKIAAKRAGITFELYNVNLALGLKYCWKCTKWKIKAFFGIDNSRYDKLSSACIECKNKTGKPRNSLTDIKRQARNAVNGAIRDGKMVPAKDNKCADCENPAFEYHHESYEKENWLKVIPVCKTCHMKRHNITPKQNNNEKI